MKHEYKTLCVSNLPQNVNKVVRSVNIPIAQCTQLSTIKEV